MIRALARVRRFLARCGCGLAVALASSVALTTASAEHDRAHPTQMLVEIVRGDGAVERFGDGATPYLGVALNVYAPDDPVWPSGLCQIGASVQVCAVDGGRTAILSIGFAPGELGGAPLFVDATVVSSPIPGCAAAGPEWRADASAFDAARYRRPVSPGVDLGAVRALDVTLRGVLATPDGVFADLAVDGAFALVGAPAHATSMRLSIVGLATIPTGPDVPLDWRDCFDAEVS